jgi:putative transposase
MQAVMEEEFRQLAGERHEQHEGRRAQRWGKEDGYCVVDGQKVPTRLRTAERREQRLWSYELFQRRGPMQLGVWDKMMRGLSTRNYGAVVKEFHNAYGIEKSAVSENFIEASREKVKELLERPLGALPSVHHRDRRHAVQESAGDRGPRYWQNGVGIARGRYGKHSRGEQLIE